MPARATRQLRVGSDAVARCPPLIVWCAASSTPIGLPRWTQSPRFPHPRVVRDATRALLGAVARDPTGLLRRLVARPPGDDEPIARCWGVELEPGDFLFFRSNTPHFAFPLGAQVSAVTHFTDDGVCRAERGERAALFWPSRRRVRGSGGGGNGADRGIVSF